MWGIVRISVRKTFITRNECHSLCLTPDMQVKVQVHPGRASASALRPPPYHMMGSSMGMGMGMGTGSATGMNMGMVGGFGAGMGRGMGGAPGAGMGMGGSPG